MLNNLSRPLTWPDGHMHMHDIICACRQYSPPPLPHPRGLRSLFGYRSLAMRTYNNRLVTKKYVCTLIDKNIAGYMCNHNLLYSRKYWRELYFGSWAPNNTLVGFKFGGLVQDRHTCICNEETLADFNLVVWRQTAKPPNLNPRQSFRLYGISIV